MRLPIDTAAVRFVTAGAAEPVLDFETRAHRVDIDGVPIYNVHLFAVGSGGRDSITVKVSGEPHNLRHWYALLSSVINGAIDDGLLTTNPLTGVKRPKIAPAKPKYLDEEEL